jgi:chromosomal replication initiation ATPase DnaA
MSQTGTIPKTFEAFVRQLHEERIYVEIAHCAEAHKVPLQTLWGRSRRGPVVRARHAAFAILRRLNPGYWTYPRIGALFDRDHSSVMDGCRKAGITSATSTLTRPGLYRVGT